jgi:hypothetical protein
MIVAVGPNNVGSGTPDQRALLPTFPGGWVEAQSSKLMRWLGGNPKSEIRNPKFLCVHLRDLRFLLGGWAEIRNPKFLCVHLRDLRFLLGGWAEIRNPKFEI